MIIKRMHEMGIRSEHAYMAGIASIGLSVFTWVTSLKAEPGPQADLARADRWGIFVGEWAPTFFGLGLALSHYEQQEGTLTTSVRDLWVEKKEQERPTA
ncbi:hypothetical protein CLM62_12940 [Streptomyces sp. SA15]|uniref:hypothetical protein n=1 Tax=Streptomyces sp. SA15 TaxID=934019 RepID=UPI000BAF3A78|nr:hypothetical protein [Streptomyces sp. SA15]PAZ15696.1 hypothetical protein CLM62_12940 [Streptomyces sp. SA15]